MRTSSTSACIVMLATFGCSSSSTTPDASAPLRPGVEDSSQTYMGTPNVDETAFWNAVLGADDNGRAAAVHQLITDVTTDSSNGYSEFLVGASYFMPPNTVLSALAAGTPPPQFRPDPAAIPVLKQSLGNLTDPFYLGFGGGLLGSIELASGDTADGGPTFAKAIPYNHAATSFMKVISDLQARDPATGLSDMYGLFEFCNGGALDHSGGDAAGYVSKMNAGSLVHRECYTGYFAPHGSSGELLIIGDLHAITGNAAAATAYYHAVTMTSDYATWPLKPLVERRLSGAQPADPATLGAITSSCATCHTRSL
jgi:hypothetical protein